MNGFIKAAGRDRGTACDYMAVRFSTLSSNFLCGLISGASRACAWSTGNSPGNNRVSRLFPGITDGAKRRYLFGSWTSFILPANHGADSTNDQKFCESLKIRSILRRSSRVPRQASPYGEKTRPGRCPEPELIALRTLMINRARQRFCQGRFPASLIYVLVVSPSPAVPSTFIPLPFRSTSAGPPVVLDTALLPCSSLSSAAKETRSDCLCLDGCACPYRKCYPARTPLQSATCKKREMQAG